MDGTRFSDLPSCLAIDILLRLPVKTLLICRYVCKDWTPLYFSDPYFISRQLQTSNIQFLYSNLITERKLRFGSIVDEVSTGNLRLETLELSCKLVHDAKYEWRVVNSCNGLLLLIDEPEWQYDADPPKIVYVCNPILGEWVSIPFPNSAKNNQYKTPKFRFRGVLREDFYGSDCALGFSAKNNQYKILSHNYVDNGKECEWQIYTLGTGRWRSIETEENIEPWKDHRGLDFNTCMQGSLHWTGSSGKGVKSFNFETERFTVFSLPEIESAHIKFMDVALGVINGCLWASFYNGRLWAMKEYGDEKSWTMMLAFRNNDYRYTEYDPPNEVLKARHKELVIYKDHICCHDLLFTLNGDEMVTSQFGSVVCYNITTGNRRRELPEGQYIGSVAYNPSFVSLQDVGRGEEVIRL